MKANRAFSTWTDGGMVTKDVKDGRYSAVRGDTERALFGGREYWAAMAKKNSSAPDLGGTRCRLHGLLGTLDTWT